jgi:hypothetical protein
MTYQKTRKQPKNLIKYLAVLCAIITINCGKITTASDELTGIWKPSDIRYSGSYFEIKKKAIIFQTKDGDSHSYTIMEIKKELLKDKDWVQYTIFYQDIDFRKVEFPFYFRSSDRGVIRFKNQPSLVWKKDVEMTS